MIKNLVVLSVLLAGASSLMAQDKLVKVNGEVIVCKVKEILDDEIKYTDPQLRSDLVFGIDKNKIKSITFEDGTEMSISDSMYGVANYEGQSKNILKTRIFGPLTNCVDLSYERSIKPGHSYELTLGYIGAGVDMNDMDQKGVYAKVGYKFFFSSDYYQKGTRYSHLLKGTYFRPELAFSGYSFQPEYYDYYNYYDVYAEASARPTRKSNYMGAVLVNLGRQWVIDDVFVIDWFVGAGYGFGNNSRDVGSHKAFAGGVSEFPIAVTSGFRLGYAF